MGTKKTLCDSCRFAYINCWEFAADECIDYEPQTHADQIRAKTDGELAAMFSRLVGCPLTVMEDCPKGHSPDGKCKAYKCWLDWLKEVAE